MRLRLGGAGLVLAGFGVGFAAAQQSGAVRAPDGGTREHVSGIYVTPVAGAPFTATVLLETTQVMEDGGTLTRHTYNQIARDSQGRVRLERRRLLPADATNAEPKLLMFYLIDVNAGTRTECDPATKFCRVLAVHRRAEAALLPAGPIGHGETLERVSLGHAQKSGLDTTGTRETVTVEPQAVGNNRVMVSRKEIWYSPELQINLSVTRQSPRSGTDVLTVGSLDRVEPPAATMTVPEGYRVVDERATTTMSGAGVSH